MTVTEWKTEGGGYKEASKTDYRRLPFYCCAISFLPFEDAVRSCWANMLATSRLMLSYATARELASRCVQG